MVEINEFLIFCWLPRPTPSEEAPGDGVCSSMETMMLEGKMAHRGGDVYVTRGSFSFPPERTYGSC